MGDWQIWYEALTKPSWTPGGETIGTIWGVLYPLIAVTHGFVLVQALRGKIPLRAAAPFALNLAANLAFTPLQFWLRSLPLAWVDILIVLGTIAWGAAAIWRRHRWVAVLQAPYFAWVAVATVLQTYITFANLP